MTEVVNKRNSNEIKYVVTINKCNGALRHHKEDLPLKYIIKILVVLFYCLQTLFYITAEIFNRQSTQHTWCGNDYLLPCLARIN